MWNDPAPLPMPDDAELERYVRQTLASLPPEIAVAAGEVVVHILDYADDETLDNMGIEDPLDLLGLYHGVSLDQKSAFDFAQQPDMVFLYRYPILNYAEETGDSLEAVVRHVVIHEIGHHFGFSDEDMEWLEANGE